MTDKPKVLEGEIKVPYQWTTGDAVGRFLTELRENKRIIGSKCKATGRVYVPPQEYSREDLSPMEYVPVGDVGTLEAVTVVKKEIPDAPCDPPYAIVAVKLDGADTNLIHLMKDGDLDALKPGMRVKAAWKEEGEGRIFDIEGFVVAGDDEKAEINDAPILESKVKEVKGKVQVPYNWAYGETLTGFFNETRENKRLMGARCTKCKGVMVPPMAICGKCYTATEKDWFPVSDHGQLVAHTVVYLPFPGQPTEPPYVYGMIKLDGVNTQYPHLIKEIEYDQIKVGMRLQAVWNEERNGDLYDIKHFKPEE